MRGKFALWLIRVGYRYAPEWYLDTDRAVRQVGLNVIKTINATGVDDVLVRLDRETDTWRVYSVESMTPVQGFDINQSSVEG